MCVGNSTGPDPQEWLLMVKIRLNSGCLNPVSIRKRLDTNWEAHWVTSHIIVCYGFLNTNKDILLKASLCPLSAKYFLELRSHGNQTHEIIQDLKKKQTNKQKKKHWHIPVCAITPTEVKQYVHFYMIQIQSWRFMMILWKSGSFWCFSSCSIWSHLLSCVLL